MGKRFHTPLALAPAAPAAPGAALLSDTELDPAALYSVTYEGLVNTNSFQQDAILTAHGHQYAAWYTSSREAVVARRALGGPWRTAVLPHRLTADDSHNAISLGVSRATGALHVAMDCHNTRLHHTESVPGLTARPGNYEWSAGLFGPVRRTLGGLELGPMTYPAFLTAPDGALQFSYRTGCSGDGAQELAELRDGRWRALGAWTSATGEYTAPNGVVSGTRNAYLHGLTYDLRGRLHAAFTWREGVVGVAGAPGGLANHDTGYAFSDDRGRTWRNAGGAVVGTTGGAPIGIASPGVLVDRVGPDRGLMNQESQAVDSSGAPHVVISHVPERFTGGVEDYPRQRAQHGRVFHLVRRGSGWVKREVPVVPGHTQRTRLVLDRADNAYLLMPRGRIVSASAASGWADWTQVRDGLPGAFGEVCVDVGRVRSEGVLSVLYQRESTRATPSPIRVADLRLG
ncbi:BNR repeat-containing protein [Actinosynnema pretiosum subsp. pretiosum]|uniref:Tat pathway signal sequence domain protein n=2 Tax=Actinosynnema TaxID=40566 RepID=C6WQT1_ACTMD|nr:BNR repeat-containing protein [Actinosynnema mirum]ACU38771.1 conserved hypothetical protein [Actinosynnema mirum DSM 43827]AXX32368.1 hypothetical protein APASM_5003 [Actinosynnema pretiosum subsp. pretiosum]QUF03694.1 BNR repeat-containing protein [Actinosynnema pretiosum subsp. pretiosum]